MEANTAEKLSQIPEEMLVFTLESALQRSGPRVGRLALQNRAPISTPNFVSITSRGVVPHLSHDNIARHTNIRSLYFGLEDFIEKQAPRTPPIYTAPVPADGSRLRTFTAHSPDSVLILGPRRYPAIPSPLANSNTKLAICTSVGFRQIDVDEYVIAGGELRPDIFLAPGDLVTDHKPSQKRVEKMGDRTAAWLRDATALKEAATERGQQFALFAPILPVPLVMQSWYLKELVEDFKHRIDGLYVHDAHSVVDLPESIQSLPRLAFSAAAGPSELLDQISLGVDLFITSFTGSATDAGIALTFSFPAPSSGEGGDGSRKAIGVDMWDTKHATDVSPFGESCECCACQKHHRAFLHHLLSAKEMLAWVLLQIHNHHVMEQFFAAVHTSITNGTFEKGRKAFDRYYEPELLITAGKGPRVRGYQVKSVGRGEPKKNVKAFNKLDDMAEALAEAKAPSPDVDAEQLEDHGLGKTQRA